MDSDVFIEPTFETIMFSIIFDKKKNSKQIFISTYNPKFAYSAKYLAYLENLLSNIKKQKKKTQMGITLIGDLNHDLLSQNGDKLIELLSGYNFIRYPNNQPTRIVKNSRTLLDVAFSTDKNLIS